MKIKLKNIGIIEDSTITLDGLTVITGKNNSGKTTVGKALYSLIDAVSNLERKAENDKNSYVRRCLEDIERNLEFLRIFRWYQSILSEKHPNLVKLAMSDHRRDENFGDLQQYAKNLFKELIEYDPESMEYEWLAKYSNRYVIGNQEVSISNIKGRFVVQREQALLTLKELIQNIEKDPELIDYSRQSINQTLRLEFAKQIQPIHKNGCFSSIDLFDQDTKYFSFELYDNSIVTQDKPVYYTSPYLQSYLIDDPYIVDDLLHPIFRRGLAFDDYSDSFINPNRFSLHTEKLRLALRIGQSTSVFEQGLLDEKIKIIDEKIGDILPGEFSISQEGDYYVHKGEKLKISNLAAGSKMFSIIKMLLDGGKLNSYTMLVLDEPEAHLHPQWQNAFAEIIVMLVKELDVNVLLTTQSSNFMLAIDAYMRKYQIQNKTNFYQTDFTDDGFVKYNCVSDDMNLIYKDFLQYLSEVKSLRNKYIHSED